MSATIAKICVICGQNVVGKPRTKDAHGHYYCQPCYDASTSSQAFTQTAPPDVESDALSELALAATSSNDNGTNAYTCPICDGTFPAHRMDDSGVCLRCASGSAKSGIRSKKRGMRQWVIFAAASMIIVGIAIAWFTNRSAQPTVNGSIIAANLPAASPSPTIAPAASALDSDEDAIKSDLLEYAKLQKDYDDTKVKTDALKKEADDLFAQNRVEESTTKLKMLNIEMKQNLATFQCGEAVRQHLTQYGQKRVYDVRDRVLLDVKTPSEYHLLLFNLSLPVSLSPARLSVTADTPKGDPSDIATGSSNSLKTTGSPKIVAVTCLPIPLDGSVFNWKFVITGNHFGTLAAFEGSSENLRITDVTSNGWVAGPKVCTVGLKVSEWTDQRIIVESFAGAYGPSGYCARLGDTLRYHIVNAGGDTCLQDFDTALPASVSPENLVRTILLRYAASRQASDAVHKAAQDALSTGKPDMAKKMLLDEEQLLNEQSRMATQLESYGNDAFTKAQTSLLAENTLEAGLKNFIGGLHLHDSPAYQAWKTAHDATTPAAPAPQENQQKQDDQIAAILSTYVAAKHEAARYQAQADALDGTFRGEEEVRLLGRANEALERSKQAIIAIQKFPDDRVDAIIRFNLSNPNVADDAKENLRSLLN